MKSSEGLAGAAGACLVAAHTAAVAEGLEGSQELHSDQLGGHCPIQIGRGSRAGKTDGAIHLVTA